MQPPALRTVNLTVTHFVILGALRQINSVRALNLKNLTRGAPSSVQFCW